MLTFLAVVIFMLQSIAGTFLIEQTVKLMNELTRKVA